MFVEIPRLGVWHERQNFVNKFYESNMNIQRIVLLLILWYIDIIWL